MSRFEGMGGKSYLARSGKDPMTIRERTRYPVAPDTIWPLLANADAFVLWNPKVSKLHTNGPFRVGDEFWTEYSLSDRTTVCSSRVTTIEPTRLLVLEHSRCQNQTDMTALHVRETFELVSRRGGAELRHTVRIRDHGLNMFVVMLFWLVTTFGTSVEADLLGDQIGRRIKAKLGQALK